MAKANRKSKAQRRAERSISLGRRVVEMAEHVARYQDEVRLSAQDRWVGSVAWNVLKDWHRDRVVLTVDPDLLGALATTASDVELSDAWLARFPYDSVAVALEEPLVIDDDGRICTYVGFNGLGGPFPPAPSSRCASRPARSSSLVSSSGLFTEWAARESRDLYHLDTELKSATFDRPSCVPDDLSLLRA